MISNWVMSLTCCLLDTSLDNCLRSRRLQFWTVSVTIGRRESWHRLVFQTLTWILNPEFTVQGRTRGGKKYKRKRNKKEERKN